MNRNRILVISFVALLVLVGCSGKSGKPTDSSAIDRDVTRPVPTAPTAPCRKSNDDPEVRRAIQSLPNTTKTFNEPSGWAITWNYEASSGNYDSCADLSYVVVLGGGVFGGKRSTHASSGTTAVLFFRYGQFVGMGGADQHHWEELEVTPEKNAYQVKYYYRDLNYPNYVMAMGPNSSFLITYSWQDGKLVSSGDYPDLGNGVAKYKQLDLKRFPANLWDTTPADKIQYLENYIVNISGSENEYNTSIFFKVPSSAGMIVCGIRMLETVMSFSNISGCYLGGESSNAVLRLSGSQGDMGADYDIQELGFDKVGLYQVGANRSRFAVPVDQVKELPRNAPLSWCGFTFYVDDSGVIIGQELSGNGFTFAPGSVDIW